jgi:opacity protein-like surface antigen
MRSIVLLLAAPALLWATSGSARNDDYERNGVILGVAGTYAINTFGDELETAYEDVFGGPASASVDDSLGISTNAGYRFHPHLSAAVEAEWLDGFRSDLSAAGLRRVAKVDIEPWVITANAKGYPLTGRYQPFLLVGLGIMTAKAKVTDLLGSGASESFRSTDFAMRFGAGFNFYVDDTFALTVGADYVLPFGSVEGLDYISIKWGIEFRGP